MRTSAVIAIGLLVAAAGCAQIVQNADFSSVAGGEVRAPQGWELPAQDGAWSVADDDGHSGKDCLRYRSDVPRPRAPVTQQVKLKPNADYVLRAWFKSDGTLTPGVRLQGKVGGKDVRAARIVGEALPEWKSAAARFNSGTAQELVLEVDAHAPAIRGGTVPAGTAWVDDVEIVAAAEAKGERGAVAVGYTGPPPGPDIAKGCSYSWNTPPNYSYSRDPGDKTQLTDGQYSVGYFWTQKSTVGWSGKSPVVITIDLGSPQPISGISYSTAAGVAGVGWPACIQVLVSDDQKAWYLAGDLVTLAAQYGIPEADKYSTFRYVAPELKTHGRYVRLMISPSGSYTFCDEIEVYQGDKGLLAANRGEPISDTEEFFRQQRMSSAIKVRLLDDLNKIKGEIADSKLSDAAKQKALQRVEVLEAEVPTAPMPAATADYRAIHPLTELHARIYAARAPLFAARNLPRFFAWQKNRWDLLLPAEVPEKAPAKPPVVRVALMNNEYRAGAFNLSNCSDAQLSAFVNLEGLPGGRNPDYATVHQVETIETQLRIPVADALPVASRTEQGWQIVCPAGMTRQVWITFHPDDLPPGTHRGTIRVTGRQVERLEVPLELTVYPFRFPDQPTCSLGLWDYTDGKGAYDIGEGNIAAAVANMRSHFVDTPWAHSGTAPWPKGFDAQGKLKEKLDFTRLKDWINLWEGSRNYAIFLAVRGSLRGIGIEDPRFPTAVKSWMTAWAEGLKELKVKPEQFYLLLVDEPHRSEQDQVILTWAQAIKAAVPTFNIWEDPTHRAPEKTALPAMFAICDVLCPNLGIFGSGTEASRQFYESYRRRGKRLWFYQCSGPSKTFDPYYYHRLQHWYAWKYGAEGSGFWAYGDAGGSGNSWNELLAGRTSYTPVYLDRNSVTDGKHFEAVREGIEDYEYLRMLRDRLAELKQKGMKGPEVDAAQRLLQTGPEEVCGPTYDPGRIPWKFDKDRSVADRVRRQVAEALIRLSGK